MSNQLSIKTVDFNGDSLKAVKDQTGNIYTGVSYICNGIGLSKSQKDTQIQNVQSDEVLKQGCLKFQAGVFDPNNETIAILIDFLPLWLAKISITPKMKENNPELVQKLINYQLKSKDVLAQAFLPQQTLLTPLPVPTQQSPSDIALYHISEAVKSMAEHQKASDETIIHIQDKLQSISEYTGNQCLSLGYELSDIRDKIEELEEKIQSYESDKAFIHKRISTQNNDLAELGLSIKRLLFGSDKEKMAQIVALFSDYHYRQWVNEEIYSLAAEQHKITGQVRKESYDSLVDNDPNLELLNAKGKCNLESIMSSKYLDARYTYALTLLGAKKRNIVQIIR